MSWTVRIPPLKGIPRTPAKQTTLNYLLRIIVCNVEDTDEWLQLRQQVSVELRTTTEEDVKQSKLETKLRPRQDRTEACKDQPWEELQTERQIKDKSQFKPKY